MSASSLNRNERPQGQSGLTKEDRSLLMFELGKISMDIRRLSDRKWYIKRTLGITR